VRKGSLLLVLLPGVIFGLYEIAPLRAQTSPTFDRQSIEGVAADQLIAFAEKLMHDGEYFRAITEYRRFLFYYPQDPRQAMVHFRIALAFYRGQSYAEALQTFR
jgi:TolA-binding protein